MVRSLFILLLANPAISFAQSNGADREELPIFIRYDNNTITPIVEFTLNGKTYKAVFDSGSYGLRILSGAVYRRIVDTIADRVSYTYGDAANSLHLRGKVASAMIRFGHLQTTAPIRLMLVDSTNYTPVGEWSSNGDSSVISSAHFRGLPAILGVSLRTTPVAKGVASPLSQLPGNGKFIVKFPRLGGNKGRLIVNPEPREMEGYTWFQLKPGSDSLPGGPRSWLDNKLNGCLFINGTGICQPTMLDCGSQGITVFSKATTGSYRLPAGTLVTLEIRDSLDSSLKISTSFKIGDNPQRNKDEVYLKGADKQEKNVFGLRTFFDFDVLYDQQNGRIGLKAK
jgi:hypothetical protein